jgi:hypothetical protein
MTYKAPIRRITRSRPADPRNPEGLWYWTFDCGHTYNANFRSLCGTDDAPCHQCGAADAVFEMMTGHAPDTASWPARVCQWCADLPCTCSWATRESIREEEERAYRE